MINPKDVKLLPKAKVIAKRSDGMLIVQVGNIKDEEIVKLVMSVDDKADLFPLTSILNHSDPDSIEFLENSDD